LLALVRRVSDKLFFFFFSSPVRRDFLGNTLGLPPLSRYGMGSLLPLRYRCRLSSAFSPLLNYPYSKFIEPSPSDFPYFPFARRKPVFFPPPPCRCPPPDGPSTSDFDLQPHLSFLCPLAGAGLLPLTAAVFSSWLASSLFPEDHLRVAFPLAGPTTVFPLPPPQIRFSPLPPPRHIQTCLEDTDALSLSICSPGWFFSHVPFFYCFEGWT